MAPRSTRDIESPSSSSMLLPQLRHSRRGSLASLSSVSQVDKDVLSQALDDIHNSASQTETLTTFNEYTSPPPSSSGQDGKGIASELQGGLSGLYSKIRASVGNVKDIVNAGGEDVSIDKSATKNTQPVRTGSVVSTKDSPVSSRAQNWPTSNWNASPASASGQHTPSGTSSTKTEGDDGTSSSFKGRKSSVDNRSTSRYSSGPATSLKPLPPTLAPAVAPGNVSPALAEVIISALRTPSSITEQSVGTNKLSKAEPGSADEFLALQTMDDHSELTQCLPATKKQPESGNSNIRQRVGHARDVMVAKDVSSALMDPEASSVESFAKSAKVDQPRSSVPTRDGSDESAGTALQPSSTTRKPSSPPMIITDQAISHEGGFAGRGRLREPAPTREPKQKGPSQHLELPLRRSLAPPLLSRVESPGPSLSRASSVDTNVDSLISVQLPSPSRDGQSGTSAGATGDRGLQARAQRPGNRDARTMNVFSQVKNKVLNKEYWMKDENARDCFCCGDIFSTFRRKHHCSKSTSVSHLSSISVLTCISGTCGQIFDAKCTSIISGRHFEQPGTLRVCKPCEGIINGNDDSSELSDDTNLALPGFRPRHGSTGASDAVASHLPNYSPTNTENGRRSPSHLDVSVPVMSIPATRKAGEKSKRKPTILEFDAERTLARPSSSRSLKSAFAGRSYVSNHRHHHSRHHFQRGFKPVDEDSAPFHQAVSEGKSKPSRLRAFHDDNIIDPDLAPYLSDDGSSGDEQMSIMTALNGDGMSKSLENDRHSLAGFVASSRKGRSKIGDKSISGVTFASRDADNHSLSGLKTPNLPRSAKRRNFSISGISHLRPSPRSYRAGAAIAGPISSLYESGSSSALAQATSSPIPSGSSRLMRSSSMRGAAAPAIELNNASLRHVRKLLNQLLQDSGVPGVASWEKALVPILLRATDDVNPDVQNGDDIDIRHYVKLKKIPGGRPGDTSYVSGLVFTKNLALKSMPRSISHPNILIITFPIEYARHQQHFMSLEPVIRQEREFLQNLVNRIAGLRPQLLLVERNVSGLALDFLEQANIATAYNVKASVLEAVSRCCQTRIISSMDKLAIKPAQAGRCASFYLKTYVTMRRKKTYMFLSGCTKELGCTIVLRGDNTQVLAKIKSITEFMIYVVYNLKLETCLMRDEFALVPSITEVGSIYPGPERRPDDTHAQTWESGRDAKTIDSGTSRNEGNVTLDAGKEVSKPAVPEEDSVPEDIPMPTFYGDMVEEHRTKILSASPFVKFMQPYLLMRAREQERRLAYLKRLRDQDTLEVQNADEKPKLEKFDLIKPEMVHERVPNASRKVREVLRAVHDAEYDKALHTYQTQSKQWEAYISGNNNLFDPYAHQNIAVLYSVVCTVTTVPCSGPDTLALGFYNEHETDADFEADCTLGQYVEDLCLGASTICIANGCEKRMIEHHRQYVHGTAQLSVFVERYPCKLRGLQDTILMWSTCRICGKETQVMHMSESSWKYSFGKYLELSFWSSDLRARAGICPHDLHRDHLRYFGFQDMAIRVHYDPITLLEIIVPRARITWKVDNDLCFKNEFFTKMEDRLNKFMYSVKARVRSINTESVLPEKIESCKQEVERLMTRASDEHHYLLQKLREKYMNSKHYEIIPLNRVIRTLQEKVAEWDASFSDFDDNFFPSEKDIRRLATLQLKKIFLDNDESLTPLAPTESTSIVPNEQTADDKILGGDVLSLAPQTRKMSPEKARNMLASVIEKDAITDGYTDQHQSAPVTAVTSSFPETAQNILGPAQSQEIQHLDLATSSELSEKLVLEKEPSTDDQIKVGLLQKDLSNVTSPSTKHNSSPSPEGPKSSGGDSPTLLDKHTQQSTNTPDPGLYSSIPRPVESGQQTARFGVPPTLFRAQSQPSNMRIDQRPGFSGHPSFVGSQPHFSKEKSTKLNEPSDSSSTNFIKTSDNNKKLSDRLGLGALKAGGAAAQSMIPLAISRRTTSPKVSNLAKHFEQLSREFEKERIRERRLRTAKSRRSRAYPMAASKPIVQIYRNVHEAVEEKDPSDEDLLAPDPSHADFDTSANISRAMAENQASQTAGESYHAEETTAENTDTEENVNDESHVGSDIEVRSDEDYSILDDIQVPGTADEHHALSPDEAQLDLRLDLPKHEKSSLMRMLTNFWAERSASGWNALEYPLNATDHIFADSDIIVREDEPSSLIAFALGSADYQVKLQSIADGTRAPVEPDNTVDGQKIAPDPTEQVEVEDSLLRPTGTHLKYQFSEGSAKMLCKVFYAEQFDALRRKCGVSDRMVESLSRCMKWDSKGGKTKSVFLKTLDDRFVLKSLSPIETQAFLRFAPAYFRIMSESLFHDLPSVIAKMLGFYQIIIKNPATGVEFNWFLLVMENLFYDRSPTRIFDLKGSMRNRRIQSTGEQNEVLLDENMVEFIYESPLFAREHSKKLLRASVWNDTLFLSRQNVMDYSLMIAIDENRKELVVGIIDCIRTYTWDKKLESWIKDRGKNRPTVTSPKEYKSRFREAMGRYVLQAPK